jgi:hypothetical protein
MVRSRTWRLFYKEQAGETTKLQDDFGCGMRKATRAVPGSALIIEVLGGDKQRIGGGLFKGESLLTAQFQYNFNLL